MNELDSLTEAFKKLSDGDELVVETEYGFRHNRTVQKEFQPGDVDPLEERFVFGAYEQCEYLVHGSRGVSIKEAQRDGFEVNGDKVVTLVNVSNEEWGGEESELISEMNP